MSNIIRRIFSDENRLKAAFHAIKVDMDVLGEKNEELKKSADEWIIFLDKENRDLKTRIRELEKKLDSFERRMDSFDDSIEEEELTVLRSV